MDCCIAVCFQWTVFAILQRKIHSAFLVVFVFWKTRLCNGSNCIPLLSTFCTVERSYADPQQPTRLIVLHRLPSFILSKVTVFDGLYRSRSYYLQNAEETILFDRHSKFCVTSVLWCGNFLDYTLDICEVGTIVLFLVWISLKKKKLNIQISLQ